MYDYAQLIKRLRVCCGMGGEAADAIEELLEERDAIKDEWRDAMNDEWL